MREVILRWDLFRPDNRGLSEYVLQRLLDLQTLVNVDYVQRHPEAPRLYESGLRYAQEGPYNEVWQGYAIMLRGEVADCEDLACARAAELIASGEDPGARAGFYGRELAIDRRLYHVVVMRSDGTIEDPSRTLGMGRKR